MLLASGALVAAGTTPAFAGAHGTQATQSQEAALPVLGHGAPSRVDSGTAARRAHGHKKARAKKGVWKVRTITYYEQIPAKWHWSLSTAVAKWNTSGAKIRFARVPTRKQALLVISYGHLAGKAGEATVGPTAHPWLRLSDAYRNADATDAATRIQVMGIFAHELGHVLGFKHTTARCALMSPMLDVVGCGSISAAKPGYYKCSTIGRTLAGRLVKLYGGRTRTPAGTWCLIDPMPPTLAKVAFNESAAPDSQVTISWARPSSAPAGSRVQVRIWGSSSCGAPPSWAAAEYVPAAAGAWQAPVDPSEAQCFSVELVNRYGVSRQRMAHKVSLPPAAAEDSQAG